MRSVWRLVLVLSLVAAWAPDRTVAADISADIAAAASERALYGLPSDPETVESILGSGQDIGTDLWGMVLTAEEEEALELQDRMNFVGELDAQLLPFVRSLDIFAGAYFVPSQGGRLVVMLTRPDADTEARVAQLTPANSRGVEISYATHTFAELRTAAEKLATAWAGLSSIRIHSAVIDERTNSLVAAVRPSELSAAAGAAPRLGEILGVAVMVIGAEPDVELVCTSRINCYDPLKAGDRIDNADRAGTSCVFPEHCCTMGFHVVINNGTNDKQFLAAGHCRGNPPKPNDWWHNGYGPQLSYAATAYPASGRDFMRVNMDNAQASNDIYGSAAQVKLNAAPTTGQPICISLGMPNPNPIQCGTIANNWTYWYGSTYPDAQMWGASYSGISANPGDSGSPMYLVNVSWHANGATAYGMLSTSTKMSHVNSALNLFDASLITN